MMYPLKHYKRYNTITQQSTSGTIKIIKEYVDDYPINFINALCKEEKHSTCIDALIDVLQ